MKSALSKQLEKLSQVNQARNLKKNTQASLIFTFQQAANFDRETIKGIAAQGLDNLINQDPGLISIKEKIFSSEYEHLYREKLTQSQNSELSNFLQGVIYDLSQYFLIEDCHKVIEYLLRNFEVHNYEADHLILAFLPYHSTVYFVKLLQNIELQKTKHWGFMDKLIKDGSTISRSFIAKQTTLDPSIMELVAKTAMKTLEIKAAPKTTDVFFNLATQSKSNKKAQLKNISVTFTMVLAIETMGFAKEKKKLNENLLITIIKFISFCFKQESLETYRSGLILATHLVSSVSLSHQFLTAIIIDVTKRLSNKNLLNDIMKLVLFIYQQSESFSMPQELFKEITNHMLALDTLIKQLATEFSCLNLCVAYFSSAFIHGSDYDRPKDLVKFASLLLELVLNHDQVFSNHRSRQDLTITLLNRLFDAFSTKIAKLKEHDQGPIILFYASLLAPLKTLLADTITESLQVVLNSLNVNSQRLPSISKLLEQTFSSIYLTTVLGLSSSDVSTLEFKDLLANILPQSTSSTQVKLQILEKLNQDLEDSIESESTLATIGSILSMHFKTHTYNEKLLIGILQSQNFSRMVPVSQQYPLLITFMSTFFKDSKSELTLELYNLILNTLLSDESQVPVDSTQGLKDLVIDIFLSERGNLLEPHIKQVKKILPIFKQVQSAHLLDETKKRVNFVVSLIAAKYNSESINQLFEEASNSKSKSAQEFYHLVAFGIVEQLAQNPSAFNDHFTNLLNNLSKNTPKKLTYFLDIINQFTTLTSIIEYSQEQKSDLYKLTKRLVEFLLSTQDPSIVPSLKKLILIFDTPLISLVYLIVGTNYILNLHILTTFTIKLVESREISANELLASILILTPLLANEDTAERKLVLPLIRKIHTKLAKKDLKQKSEHSFNEFLSHPLSGSSNNGNIEEILFSGASIDSLVIALNNNDNEIFSLRSEEIFPLIFEKFSTEYSDHERLFEFFSRIICFISKSLFAFVNQYLQYAISKFSKKLLGSNVINTLFLNAANLIQAEKPSTNTVIEIISTTSQLSILGNTQEIAELYIRNILVPAASLQAKEPTIANHLISNLPVSSYKALSSQDKTEFVEYLLAVAEKGTSTSVTLSKFEELSPETSILVKVSSNLIDNLESGQNLAKLEILSEILRNGQKKPLDYLPILNNLYKRVTQEPKLLSKLNYSLTNLISLHQEILQAVVENKTPIDYSILTDEADIIENPNKKSVPVQKLVGAFSTANESYEYINVIAKILEHMLTQDNIHDLSKKAGYFVLARNIFTVLARYSYFIFNHVSNLIVTLLLSIFDNFENKAPTTQGVGLRLFREVLSLSIQEIPQFELHTYLPLILKTVTLRARLLEQTQTISSKDYQSQEVKNEINNIINIVANKNIEYLIYSVIHHYILQSINTSDKQAIPKNLSVFQGSIEPTASLMFTSGDLDDSLSYLHQFLKSNYDLTSFFIYKALNLKKVKSLFKQSSLPNGKNLANNFGLSSLQTLRIFLMMANEIFRASLQSKDLLTLFSEYFVKGNIKGNTTQTLSDILSTLAQLRHLISFSQSTLEEEKDETSEKTEDKKSTSIRAFITKSLNTLDQSLTDFQTFIPEEIITRLAIQILQSEAAPQIKSYILQIYYDKISVLGNPKISNEIAAELKKNIENELSQHVDTELDSSTIAYVQSLFLTLNCLIKKKPKSFDSGISEVITKYSTLNLIEVRCSAFYTICLYNEKYGIKNLETLPGLVEELLKSLSIFTKVQQPENFEILRKVVKQTEVTLLDEIFSKIEELNEQDLVNLEGSFIICLNCLVILLKSYQDIVHPYVLSFLLLVGCVEIHQERIDELFQALSKNLQPRNLIESVARAVNVQHEFSPLFGKRMAILLKNICSNLDKDTFESRNQSLFKIYLQGFDYARIVNFAWETADVEGNQSDLDGVQLGWVEAFSAFAIKTNEVQLKKFFLKLNEWSGRAFDAQEAKFSILRKIVLLELIMKLFDTIKSYFVPYMAFVFDFCIDQLTHYAKVYSEQVAKSVKRKMQSADLTVEWEIKLHKHILDSMTKCFQNDKEEFIDTTKFEKLITPLTDQIDCISFPDDYSEFIGNHVQPTIIQLFELIKDDYKWKSLNYSLMMKTRSDDSAAKIATLKIVLRMADQFKERIIVILSDILPFIAETLEDENIQVEKISKEIILRLEQNTGEDIKEYLKS